MNRLLAAPLAALLLAAAAPAPFLPGVVSTAANEYNPSLTEDGRLMVFARSAADFADARIMTMQKTAGGWSAPQPIAFSDARYSDSDPWLTPDGGWLYFISNRPADGRAPDRRDFDLWRARRSPDGSWAAPEHLAGASSPAQELGPERHGQTLYFNSSRKGGPGGLDIYAAELADDGSIGAAAPLPAPINSPQSEGDFTLSRDGTQAFFWSTRGGKGELYSARRTGDQWAEPVKLADVNDGPFTFTPALDRRGQLRFYASTRPRDGQAAGMADIYEADVRP